MHLYKNKLDVQCSVHVWKRMKINALYEKNMSSTSEMEKLEATESRIKDSSHSTGNKWSQKRSILVLHTNDITVGGGLRGLWGTTFHSQNLALLHPQSVLFLISVFYFLHKWTRNPKTPPVTAVRATCKALLNISYCTGF